MADRLDEILGSLGEGTPFPVDWDAYERKVLLKLAQRERVRRLRGRLVAAASAAVGAAAAVLVAVAVMGPSARESVATLADEPSRPGEAVALAAREVQRPTPRTPGTPIRAARKMTRSGSAILHAGGAPAARGSAPVFARISSRRAGRGEIRFDGFTAADDDSPGCIVALAAAE